VPFSHFLMRNLRVPRTVQFETQREPRFNRIGTAALQDLYSLLYFRPPIAKSKRRTCYLMERSNRRFRRALTRNSLRRSAAAATHRHKWVTHPCDE